MSQLERLSVGGTSEERQLLRAGRGLRPNAASKRRALLGLGLGSAAIASPTTAAALTKIKASFGVAWPILASKWAAAVVIVSVGASLAVVNRPRRPVAPTPVERSLGVVASGNPASNTKPSADTRKPQPEAGATPPLEGSSTVNPLAAPTPPRLPSLPKPSEVELFDAARHRLRSGDPSGALGALGDQLRQYPAGNLALEARALRIEALEGAGQRQRAVAEARAFLAQNPSGLTSHRVRRWLEKRSKP
jgi:hypothetical protein